MTAVSVVGLGKLGACIAAAMAHKGLDVVGVDHSERAVASVNVGKAPVNEPGLDEIIAASSRRLRATSDYRDAVLSTEATFVVVPTPSETSGGFSLRHVAAAGESIGRALAEKGTYHLVVLTSTVLPGGTEEGMLAALERESRKACGRDFGLCYSPAFIALGTALRDFLNPDFVLIGQSDIRAGDELARLYTMVLDTDAPIQRMAIQNAELTKIALNTFITTKITFANMLAQMCERLPHGDVDAVTSALGLDSRVGQRYLSAGLGYGGPCFPRDNRALRFWADQIGTPALLANSTDELDRELGERIVARIRQHCPRDATVAVLGLTYKPGSTVLEGSWPLHLATRLAGKTQSVIAHDPLLATLPRDAIDGRLELVTSLPEVLARADVVVLSSPDQAYADLQPADFPAERTVIIDCWRLLRASLDGAPGIEYVGLGLRPKELEAGIDRGSRLAARASPS